MPTHCIMKLKKVFLAVSALAILFPFISIITVAVPKSYSQSAESHCLDFEQDFGPVIDCFVSDELCDKYTDGLAYDVRVLTPCHESERE
jgi:hypothetical protein